MVGDFGFPGDVGWFIIGGTFFISLPSFIIVVVIINFFSPDWFINKVFATYQFFVNNVEVNFKIKETFLSPFDDDFYIDQLFSNQ